MPYLAPDKQGHQDRGQCNGKKGGKEHRKGLRVGQRLEEPSRLRLQCENGKKSHADDKKRKEKRRADLLGGFDDHIRPVPGPARLLPLLQFFMGVFHHDDGGVHHRADRDGDAAQTHDVRRKPKIIHADEGNENGNGQRENDHESAGQMEKKDDADHADRDRQFDDLFLQGIDGALDQVGSVIGGDNLHPFGKAGDDILFDPLLDPFDHIEDVFAKPDHDNAGRHLALAVEFRQPPPDLRPESDVGHILQQDRRPPAVRADRDLGQILQPLDIAPSPDHVFDPGKFKNPAFHIAVALFDRLDHRHEGYVVGQKPVGIDGDLVLFDKAAQAGDLGDARHAFDGQLYVIVLNGAELRQVVSARLVDHRIGKTPADGRGIGAQNGIDVGGDFRLHRLQVFENPASRPVDVRPFVKYDVDKRTSEK